jgi:hypothetical protein
LGFAAWKLSLIKRTDCRIYIETSHVLSKGFVEPFVALGLKPLFVDLRRDTREVAISHLRKNAVPGRTPEGFKFLLSPDEDVFLPIDGWKDLSDYQLCYWYALERNVRSRVYRSAMEQLEIPVGIIETEELNDRDRVRALAELIGISPSTQNIWNFGWRNVGYRGEQYRCDEDMDAPESVVISRLESPKTPEEVLEAISSLRELAGLQ